MSTTTNLKPQLTACEAIALVRSTYKTLPANPRTLAAHGYDRAVVDICPDVPPTAHRRGAIRPRVVRISAEVIEDDNGELHWEGIVYDLDGSEVAFSMSDYDPIGCEFRFTGDTPFRRIGRHPDQGGARECRGTGD